MFTSTQLIDEFNNRELPMLREKDFRGDEERMAYTAYLDGFALGVGIGRDDVLKKAREWFKQKLESEGSNTSEEDLEQFISDFEAAMNK